MRWDEKNYPALCNLFGLKQKASFVRHVSDFCVCCYICGGMTCCLILQALLRICCPLAVEAVMFSPYLSSRCWEAPCVGSAASPPKRLMHPGRETQPAVGLLIFKVFFPPHPFLLPSVYPYLSPLLHPSKEDSQGDQECSSGETSAGSVSVQPRAS